MNLPQFSVGDEVFVIVNADRLDVIKGKIVKINVTEVQNDDQTTTETIKYYVQYQNSNLNTTSTSIFDESQLFLQWADVENELQNNFTNRINELKTQLGVQ